MAYGLIAIGLALLFAGGEALVRGGVGLSRFFGFSPLLIGLVVISAGTSAPELLIAVQAVTQGNPALAAGNIVGSNIANILLILGIGAMIRPMESAPKVVFRDGGTMLIASIVFVLMAWNGMVTSRDGWFLVTGLLIFMALLFFFDWRRPATHSVLETRAAQRANGLIHPGTSLFFLLIGGVLLYFGAQTVVNGSVAVARQFDVPQSLIGLTLVAVGTSLPELATTIVAAFRRQTALAIGNLVGSNIFNILGVLGITALVHPVAIPAELAHQDMLVMLGVAALLPPLLYTSWRLSRSEGLLLVLLYGSYVAFLAWRQGMLPL